VQVGRDKLSWGAGKSGNLMVSNNLPYQQFGRFTTGFDQFKYTLLSSFLFGYCCQALNVRNYTFSFPS